MRYIRCLIDGLKNRIKLRCDKFESYIEENLIRPYLLTPLTQQVEKEIIKPITSSIVEAGRSSAKLAFLVGAIHSRKSYEDFKKDVVGMLEKIDKDREFWEKYL